MLDIYMKTDVLEIWYNRHT